MTVFLLTFFGLMLLGTPICFCMLGSSVCYILVHDISARVIVEKFCSGPNSFTLLAIPFFILAANLMNNGGVTDRMFNLCRKWVGHFTGGLGHVNVLASVIFAGMSGAAVADAGGLGQLELKAMRDAHFDDDFTLAVTGASSTIGPVIPPSIPAVVYAVSAGCSIGGLFIAGIIPGLLMAGSMCMIVYVWARLKKYEKDPKASWKERLTATKRGLLSLLTPVIIIGGIWSGKFTPTEAAVVASVYAAVLSFGVYRELHWRDLKALLLNTAEQTIVSLCIIASSAVFGWVLTYERIPQQVSKWFLSLSDSPVVFILLSMGILLIVGCFMETIAAITIMTPVLLPVATSMGYSPVHFGVVMILTLMIGLITPPVGLVTYTLANISGVSFTRISKATVPFLLALIEVLIVIALVPQISLFLPGLVG